MVNGLMACPWSPDHRESSFCRMPLVLISFVLPTCTSPSQVPAVQQLMHAEVLKTSKYAQLGSSYLFIPIAVETFGHFGPQVRDLEKPWPEAEDRSTPCMSFSSKVYLSPSKVVMLSQCCMGSLASTIS